MNITRVNPHDPSRPNLDGRKLAAGDHPADRLVGHTQPVRNLSDGDQRLRVARLLLRVHALMKLGFRANFPRHSPGS